jgi:hypothetical protein
VGIARSLLSAVGICVVTAAVAVAMGMPLVAEGGRGMLGAPGAILLLYTLAIWLLGRASRPPTQGPPAVR